MKKTGSVFEQKGVPPIKESIPLALQHVAAMIVGAVTPSIIVAGIAGLSPEDSGILIQSALIIAAIATFIQLFPFFKGRIGSGLPVIMGVGFAYMPTLISITGEYNLATVFGAQLIGGMLAIIVGIFVKRLHSLFPSLVTGTVVFTIGLSLYPTAVSYMAGGNGSVNFGAPINWLVAMVTFVVVIFFGYFTKGFMKLASILIGIVFGYLLSFFLGMVSFESVGIAGWVQIPIPLHFGMEFQGTAIITMAIMYIVNSVQAIGDLSATSVGGLDRDPSMKELSGGIVGNGISSILGAFFGGLPTSTYSQNVGIVATTKVVNHSVLGISAGVILLAGLMPKFSAVLTTIPACVLGGATVAVFASITMTGIKLIIQSPLTPRNMAVVGLSVAMGMGITQTTNALSMFPSWVNDIFGGSPVVIATILAITLNLVLPKDTGDELIKVKEGAEELIEKLLDTE